MALTIPALVKAFLERADLSPVAVPIYTEKLPDKEVPMPYIVVHEPHASPPDPNAAPQSKGGHKGVITELQIDVFQHNVKRLTPGSDKRTKVYDPLLPEMVVSVLHGARLQASFDDFPARVYGCRVVDGPHGVPTPRAQNEAHHVIDIRINRDLVTTRP